MVEVGKFVDGLKSADVEFFAGVPDVKRCADTVSHYE